MEDAINKSAKAIAIFQLEPPPEIAMAIAILLLGALKNRDGADTTRKHSRGIFDPETAIFRGW